MWELDHKEGWAPKNWCFWTVVLEKTVESLLDFKEIQPVHPKEKQLWIFIGRTDAEVETPVLWPPDAKNWLTGKDPDAGKDWRRVEKGMRVSSGSWWWTGRPAVLQSVGSQSQTWLSDWADWYSLLKMLYFACFSIVPMVLLISAQHLSSHFGNVCNCFHAFLLLYFLSVLGSRLQSVWHSIILSLHSVLNASLTQCLSSATLSLTSLSCLPPPLGSTISCFQLLFSAWLSFHVSNTLSYFLRELLCLLQALALSAPCSIFSSLFHAFPLWCCAPQTSPSPCACRPHAAFMTWLEMHTCVGTEGPAWSSNSEGLVLTSLAES